MVRGTSPSVRCAGCHQGFHEPCLENLGLPAQENLKWHMILLCPQCKPYFRVMTSKGGRTGRERPRANRRSLQAAAIATAPQTAGDDQEQPVQDNSGENATNESVTLDTESPSPPPLPPPPDRVETEHDVPVHSEQERQAVPQASAVVPNWSPGSPVCESLLRGDCPYGITGRTGGLCPQPHPKRCDKYLTWGSGGDKGCDGSNCGKFHPEVCPSSVHLQCFDKNCKWKLHTRKCRRPGQPDSWQVQGPRSRPQNGGQGAAQGRPPQGGAQGGPQGNQRGGRQQGRQGGYGGHQGGQGKQNQLFQLLSARQSQPGAMEEQLQTLISLMQILAPQGRANTNRQGGRRRHSPSY